MSVPVYMYLMLMVLPTRASTLTSSAAKLDVSNVVSCALLLFERRKDGNLLFLPVHNTQHFNNIIE